MAVNITHDPIRYFIEVFESRFKIDCEINLCADEKELNGNLAATIFSTIGDPHEILIYSYDKNMSQIYDLLCHELAHILAGVEHEHDEVFEKFKNEIYDNYCNHKEN